ncbi:MAG: hypothetical protein ACI81S_000880 [Sphingobacteriales bacterium]|jgi:hypothetical protein
MRLRQLFLFVCFSGILSAQAQDSTVIKDVESLLVADTGHSSKKAVRLSKFLPGAGQIYNDKIWKAPIIYGGFVALGLAINFNHSKFKEFNAPLVNRLNGDSTDVYLNQFTNDNLRTLKNFYQRNRDLSIIGCVVLYTLQIVDAYVDAELYDFDISDDLSLRVHPEINFSAQRQVFKPVYGLKLNFALN